MPASTPVTKEQLFKHFAGQATALERKLIEQWLALPGNEEFFFACLHEWETRNQQYSADLNAGLARFKAHMAGTESSDAPQAREIALDETYASVGRNRSWAWRVAASVLVVLGIGGWFAQDSILNKTYETGAGQVLSLTLPDNSKVVLNSNSLLRIPRFGFGSQSRNVYLTGEANFSVVHTADDKPFIVGSQKNFKVTVLGTVFTVLARAERSKVVLKEGKVKVDFGSLAQGKAPFIMTPGQVVRVDAQTAAVSVKNDKHPDNHAAWRYHRFVFENTDLAEIASLIEDDYGLDVELNGRYLNRETVSGSFHAADANELLQGLSEAMDINVVRQDDRVIITDHSR